jgi:hypothetical protein
MKTHYSHINVISIIGLTTVWLFFASVGLAQSQPSPSVIDPDIAEMLSTNPPPPGFATRLDYIKSFTKEKDILDAYHKSVLDKGEAMVALAALDDQVSMDTYGKVVDQNGNPIAGVKVNGHLGSETDSYTERNTTTDASGLFHFLGLHGSWLAMHFQKDGYEFDERLLPERPKNYLPDLNNPLVITMWKLKGAEPMKHSTIHAYIPCDGSITRFDLLSGKQDPNGDFSISLSRNPANIIPNKPFSWSVTFEVTNGGLQGITNIYPYEALMDGYQSRITFDFPTNAPKWSSLFTPALYFKSKDGKIFCRMTVKIMADFQPPPTLFRAEIYANPAGSRNLEFDPAKQIRQ